MLKTCDHFQGHIHGPSTKETEERDRFIYLGSGPTNGSSDISSLPADAEAISETTDDSPPENEGCIVPLRRSTRQKRPSPRCTICDDEMEADEDGVWWRHTSPKQENANCLYMCLETS